MSMQRETLWRSKLRNAAQSLLIGAGVAVLMAIPAWILAGGAGVVWTMGAVLMGLMMAGHVPARYVLARSGAVPLPPRQAPDLYRLLAALYERAGCETRPILFYVPSPGLNAFAVGGRNDGGITVTEGLLRALNMRQLAGVLAHEVSHLRNGDTRVMAMASAAGEVTALGALFIQISVIVLLPWIIAGEVDLPWLALLAAALAPTASSLLQLALSRTREYAADLDAAATTGDPGGLASALEVLEKLNGGWLAGVFGVRQSWPLEWLRSHPDTAERIRRLLTLESQPPPDTMITDTVGPASFQRPQPASRRWYFYRY